MKISIKLVIGFAIVMALAVIVGTVGIVGMQSLRKASFSMYERQVAGLEFLAKANFAIKQARIEGRQVVIASFYDDLKGAIDARDRFKKYSLEFEYWMTECRNVASSEEFDKMYSELLSVYRNEFTPVSYEIMQMSIDGIPNHYNKLDINIHLSAIANITNQIESYVTGLMDLLTADAENNSNTNSVLTQRFMWAQATLLLVAFVLSIWVAHTITRSVVTPITESARVLSKIAKGDFDARVQGQYVGEFAVMKNAVNAAAFGLASFLNDKIEAERSAYEAQMAKSVAETTVETRMRFLANMSHEIRTPMNGVIGLAELALDDEDTTPKSKDYLRKIKHSADGLLSIINDILDVTKIDAGELTLEHIPFDLREVFEDCRSILAHKAESKGIGLNFFCESSLRHKIYGDPTKLRQALLNLLSNSLKFTSKGAVTLVSRVEPITKDTINVFFEVSDTGIGMNQQQVLHVFDAFKQADESTARVYGGTGLGLSITQKIIQLMGSKIIVESALSVGTKFSFSLSFDVSDISVEDFKTAYPTARVAPHFSGTVLVCEDNETNQLVARANLEKVGFTVVIAQNGLHAVNLVDAATENGTPFDVIFMDIQMPVMDGLQATRRLIENGIKTPIIAMTANAMGEDRRACFVAGMTDYMSKPFKQQDLWSCLLKYCTPVAQVELPIETLLKSYTITVLDVPLGVQRCAGSTQLHEKLMHDFLREQPKVKQKLLDAIKHDEHTVANRIAHSAKSVAATVGADGLANALLRIEQVMRDEHDAAQVKALFAVYEKILAEVLDAITSYFLKHTSTPQETKEVPEEEFLSLLREIRPSLEQGLTLEVGQIERMRQLPSTVAKARELLTLIEEYEFEDAVKVLDEIAAQIVT